MLRISKLADYATVIMHCLASRFGETLSASEIAQCVHLPNTTVSKILKMLSEAGLLISLRGAYGGYQLAHAPHAISLREVITAIEGRPSLTECSQTLGLCAQDSVCAIKHNWKLINRFILEAFSNLTLADMAKPLSFSALSSSHFIKTSLLDEGMREQTMRSEKPLLRESEQ